MVRLHSGGQTPLLIFVCDASATGCRFSVRLGLEELTSLLSVLHRRRRCRVVIVSSLYRTADRLTTRATMA